MAIIKNSPISGKGLFTFKAQDAGKAIFAIERPLVAVLDAERLSDTCSECFTWTADSVINQRDDGKKVTVSACSQCKLLSYCSKRCQSKAWKRSHKYECAILQRMKEASQNGKIPHAIRMLLQLLVLRSKDAISNDQWLALLELEHHIDARRVNKDAYEDMMTLAKGTLSYSGTEQFFNLDFVEKMFARILTNSMTLVTQTFDPLGVLLDPHASRANHSCDPNTIIVMDGPEMQFRSLRPLKADEEITINYVDTTNPYDRRQFELKARYLFDCKCSKCQKGLSDREDEWLKDSAQLDERWSTMAQQMAADDPALKQRLGPSPVQNENLVILENFAFRQKEAARYSDSIMEKVNTLENAVKMCGETKIYPLHRQPYPALRHELLVAYLTSGTAKDISTAFIHALKRYFSIDPVLYPEPFHPVRVVHNWTLAKMALYLADARAEDSPMTAMTLLENGIDLGLVIFGLLFEVQENVGKSHGQDSTFAKMVRSKFDEVRTDMTRGDPGLMQNIASNIKSQWQVLEEFSKVLEY